jgi:hypothetical protein
MQKCLDMLIQDSDSSQARGLESCVMSQTCAYLNGTFEPLMNELAIMPEEC